MGTDMLLPTPAVNVASNHCPCDISGLIRPYFRRRRELTCISHHPPSRGRREMQVRLADFKDCIPSDPVLPLQSGTGQVLYLGSFDKIADSCGNGDASHYLDLGKCIGINILLVSCPTLFYRAPITHESLSCSTWRQQPGR